MTYDETVNWMFSRLPMYQTQGATAYKENLDNTLLLCKHLGNPENRLKFIHVAGTNGKGSTSHMLASILQEAGYRTGLYTSPHLKDFRERIKIDGTEIPKDAVTGFISEHKSFLEANSLSFFEMSVGLAFDYFDKQNVDIAIIEVGLGGRLDATNVITPILSVITNIGIDHTQFLGKTVDAIAAEKAGIIKQGIPVVIGETTSESRPVFEAKAQDMKAPLYFASQQMKRDYPSDLHGEYQAANRKTVMQSIAILRSGAGFEITESNVRSGFMNVVKNTGLQGRWQQLRQNPTVICDTAHNRHGLEVVVAQLQKQRFDNLHIVLGVVNDKDLAEILPILPKEAIYYFCKPNIFRGLDAAILQKEAAQFDLYGAIYVSVADAYEKALTNAASGDLIYIGGSTFVVAEVL